MNRSAFPMTAGAAALVAACTSAPTATPAPAPRPTRAQPCAGLEARPITALAPGKVDDLLAGREATYALVAELNHHPGPSHALDLAAELGLSPEQHGARQRSGQDLVDREVWLDGAFAEGTARAERVTELTAAAETEGGVPVSHLRAHPTVKAILTPEQVARHDRLRGSAGAEHGHGG